MNKKVLFAIIALFGIITNGNAQLSLGKPAGDVIIEKALTGSFVLVEQKYQLKEVKTGDLYGRGGNDEFGKVYSIGIMTKIGLIVSDEVAHPWNYDDDFKQYSENKKYEPVRYTTSIKTAGQSEFKQIDTDNKKLKEVDKHFFVLPQENKKTGLALSDTTGVVDGWILWATIPFESDMDAKVELKQMMAVKKQFEMKEKEFKVDTPQSLDKVKMGFFTVPRITEMGTITFEVIGVLYKKDAEWMCVPVSKSWKADGKGDSVTADSDDKDDKDKSKDGDSDELTPSGQGGKVKKGCQDD